MKKLIFIACAVVFGITLNSCDSNNSSSDGTYAYKVRMTDAPGPYDEVNIDLQAVIVTNSDGQTTILDTEAGIYNLLDYSNGVNVVIAESGLNDPDVQSVRLVLGTNSTVVVDGTSYPLSTPSAEQSGLKVIVNQTLDADTQNEILIDFDAYTSVVATGAGTYKLKPVLRTINVEATGEIKGSLDLVSSISMVTATSSTNVEYTSSVNNAGQFKISGLPAGTYTLTATPKLPLLPIIQTNVTVTAGTSTNVGTIEFL